MTGRWIICEKTGSWATALRWASGAGTPRLYETRSLIECRQELVLWPNSLLTLEVTLNNLEHVLRLTYDVHQRFARAGVVALASAPLAPCEDLLREAGALHVALSPRRLDCVARLAERHLANAPRPLPGPHEEIWSRLAWGEE